MTDGRAIGVFDSGVGGLTVARAIAERLPGERICYLGDTARSPYGPRPVDEIRRFALEIADLLVRRDVKMLVVACNSIEVAAIEDLAASHGVPVVGVIDPGVRAAARATRSGVVGLIGTQATVASGAYDRAVARAAVDMQLRSVACPAFVDHVERGDTSSPGLRAAAEGYLAPLRGEVDTLILGCTHYPMLSGLLRSVMGDDVVLVSSAEETADDVYGTLVDRDLLRGDREQPEHEFLCTADPQRFRAIAARFLGPRMGAIDLASLDAVTEVSWN